MKKEDIQMIENVKSNILIKFPLLGSVMANLDFKKSRKITTASTNGEVVLYNKKYIDNLTNDQKTFIFAHEIMHVAFDHILRSKNKDQYVWNIATDSVINQMLIAEKLPMIDGGVDIKEAINKSAEEMYQKLLKDKKNNKNQDQNSEEEFTNAGHDDHNIWKEIIEKLEKHEKKTKDQHGLNQDKNQNEEDTKNNKQNDEDNQENSQNQSNYNEKVCRAEKEFTKANKELKEKIGQEIRDRLKKEKEKTQIAGSGEGDKNFTLGEVGKAKPIISWKKILREEIEKEDDRWSYRRSSDENDFQARIESLEVNERPVTEVMLDTSGSVNESLLRNFLKQLKPLLKESKLYVGCFDTRFYGFSEIKKSSDIDKLNLKGGGGTSFNMALNCFSRDKKINKIVFTDGKDMVYESPENLKKKVIWIVFDNEYFTTKVGKVIRVNSSEIYNIKYSKNDEILF
ncbi:MAG: hypothetical protein E7359_02045 [Clostridiales bacterium]|nr:hypothetical protein [Clostridiales bacterium]